MATAFTEGTPPLLLKNRDDLSQDLVHEGLGQGIDLPPLTDLQIEHARLIAAHYPSRLDTGDRHRKPETASELPSGCDRQDHRQLGRVVEFGRRHDQYGSILPRLMPFRGIESPNTPPTGSTNCCRGTGSHPRQLIVGRPDLISAAISAAFPSATSPTCQARTKTAPCPCQRHVPGGWPPGAYGVAGTRISRCQLILNVYDKKIWRQRTAAGQTAQITSPGDFVGCYRNSADSPACGFHRVLIEKFGADKKAAGRAPPQVKSTGSPRLGISPPSRKDRRSRKRIIAGVVGILFLVAAGIVGWHLRSLGSDETRSAPRLSIVVLPFANLSAIPSSNTSQTVSPRISRPICPGSRT